MLWNIQKEGGRGGEGEGDRGRKEGRKSGCEMDDQNRTEQGDENERE